MPERSVDPARALVLSLKPRFAEAILAGTETAEVRWILPRIAIRTLALLYASGSERALVGTCVVRSVDRYQADERWHLHGADTALSKTEFDAYLDGRDCSVVLLLERPEPLTIPIPLHTLTASKPSRSAPCGTDREGATRLGSLTVRADAGFASHALPQIP
ncbi:hypothetical protein [Candidatus Poriferisodalis sp.]|uniref:hypothetical protein n=1 Tax=Candidatus Poriferisodalis sp. TaxID=3101277 RepID=UPI003B01C25A